MANGRQLSPREKQLYEMLLTHPGGMKEIAYEMGVTTRTAKQYLNIIKLKIGAVTRPTIMQREIMSLRKKLESSNEPPITLKLSLPDVPAWEI